jgi:hypothetical protein
VAEFLLHRAALQELQVVDDEDLDPADRFLVGDRRLLLSADTKLA